MRRTTPTEGLPRGGQRPDIGGMELMETCFVPRAVPGAVAIMDATQGQGGQGKREAWRSGVALTASVGAVTWSSASGRQWYSIMADANLHSKLNRPGPVESGGKVK